VSVHLLDVNVLIAMTWPTHESHKRVLDWFAANPTGRWATCPLTQAGFVRILSNPVISRDAPGPEDVLKMLERNIRNPLHEFWPDDISFAKAVEPVRKRITGHQQVSDAYLVGLAIHHSGKLVTLDRSIVALLAANERGTVVTL
jgi:hypothetical protein